MSNTVLTCFTENWTCREGFYKCRLGPCINQTLKCNDYPDCVGTWDDEDNCSKHQYYYEIMRRYKRIQSELILKNGFLSSLCTMVVFFYSNFPHFQLGDVLIVILLVDVTMFISTVLHWH